LNQGIGKLAGRAHVQQAEVLAGQRILVPVPQETEVPRGFQIVERLRVQVVLAVKKLDGALILQSAIDGHLLASALRFEGDARDFDEQGDGDAGGQQEYQQHRESGLLAAPFHPASSASSGSVC
jgi:hypothetical protein